MTMWYSEAMLPSPFCPNCGSRLNFLAVKSNVFDSSTGTRLYHLLYWCPNFPSGWKRFFSGCVDKRIYGGGYDSACWNYEFTSGQINRWFYKPRGVEFMRRVDDV